MWPLIVSVCALLVAAIPIVYMAKANARENERQRQLEIAAAKAEAERPLKDRITDLERQVAEMQRTHDKEVGALQATNRDQAKRIEHLEDELRRNHK